MIKKILTHPLFSGSFLMVGGSLFVNAVNYLYHLVMGRIMGPEVYGGLASIFSILYIVSIIPTSASFAVVKFISDADTSAKRNEIYTAVKRLFFKLATWGAILLLVLSPVIKNFLHLDDLLAVIFVAPIFFLTLVILANQSTLQGLLKFMGVVGPNLISALGKLIFGVVFVLIGWQLGGATFAIVLGAIVAYFYSKKETAKYVSEVKTNYNLTSFIKYALPVLVQALAFTSFFTFDLILAKHFLSAFDAGLYAALSTLGKIIFFAAQPLTGVMFPMVAGRRAKGEKYRHIFYLTFLVTIAISLLIVGFYYLYPNLAIGLLYGEKYLSATRELVWMGAFLGVYTLAYLLVNFVLSLGRTIIVALPFALSVVQILAIIARHDSILQIIQISLLCVSVVFVGVLGYLGYNEAKRYGKSN